MVCSVIDMVQTALFPLDVKRNTASRGCYQAFYTHRFVINKIIITL